MKRQFVKAQHVGHLSPMASGRRPVDDAKLVQERGPLPPMHPRAIAARLAERYDLKSMTPDQLRDLARRYAE